MWEIDDDPKGTFAAAASTYIHIRTTSISDNFTSVGNPPIMNIYKQIPHTRTPTKKKKAFANVFMVMVISL